jgi:hypothetical protein
MVMRAIRRASMEAQLAEAYPGVALRLTLPSASAATATRGSGPAVLQSAFGTATVREPVKDWCRADGLFVPAAGAQSYFSREMPRIAGLPATCAVTCSLPGMSPTRATPTRAVPTSDR